MFRRSKPTGKFYRLDFRPPSEILVNGMNGTDTNWYNNIFEENTIFASKSLKGISRFFLESVMNKNIASTINPIANITAPADPNSVIPFAERESAIDPNVAGPSSANPQVSSPTLRSPLAGYRHLYPENQKCYIYEIEVELDKVIDVCEDLKDINTERGENSRLFNFRKDLSPVPINRSPEYLHSAIKGRLTRYYNNCARYTEEVIIRGPIPAKKIKLYQSL